MPTTQNKDYYGTARRQEDGLRGRDPQGLPQARAQISPDVNPNDKKAEEKFKEISEANDILSDEKKRKVYDQVGFYSDQIDPARPRPTRASRPMRRQAPPVDFGGFDFSGFQARAGTALRAAGRRFAILGQLPRHLLRHLYRE
jgi:molecular chaperone DnaJ